MRLQTTPVGSHASTGSVWFPAAPEPQRFGKRKIDIRKGCF